MKVHSIDHVQLAIPPGQEDRARDFYVDILGFTEAPRPEPLSERKGAWFTSGNANIHVGVENDFRPALKAHPALVVDGLDEVIKRCEIAGLPVTPAEELTGWRRVHISDPFGNRIELMEKT
ncbi:MAG TPA: VOC family protein [Blastocatellia bacterium]|nr:VOC family protein [Blastocatellia bacterium]